MHNQSPQYISDIMKNYRYQHTACFFPYPNHHYAKQERYHHVQRMKNYFKVPGNIHSVYQCKQDGNYNCAISHLYIKNMLFAWKNLI